MKRENIWYRFLCYVVVFSLVFSSIPPFLSEQVEAEEDVKSYQKEKASNTAEMILQQNTKEMDKKGLKEVPNLRNEVSKVFIDEEGTYFAEVYLEPIHFEENGVWKEIENDLVTSTNGEFIENKENSFSVQFPKQKKGKKSNELFKYAIDEHEMSVNLVAAKNEPGPLEEVTTPEPQLQSDLVVYDNVLKDVTIEYAVEGSTVKENIILDSYQGNNTFQFELNVQGLNAIQQEDGSINFYNQEGKFTFLIERPYMYDSNQTLGEEGVISHDITQQIEKTETGYLLTLTASEEYLKDPSRVYPVTLDPWIDVFQAEDTFVASDTSYNYHNTDYLFVGKHSAIGKTRSLVKFGLPNIPNGVVTGAILGLYQNAASNSTAVNVHELTSAFSTKSVTWASQPKYNPTVVSSNTKADIGYTYFDVSSLVKEWYDMPNTNYGMMLKYADNLESSAERKGFYSTELLTENGDLFGKPKLVVEFRPIELLGLADYWSYTPDIFQGEGSGVVNVINGNMVYDISLLSLNSKVGAFDLDVTYNSRSNYNTHYGLGWMFSPHESLIFNADQSIIEYRAEGGVRYHFTKQQHDNASSYSSPEGVEYELTKTSTGFELKDTSETIRYFDSKGRNYETKDEKGNRIIYTFENDSSTRVMKVTEKTGTNGVERILSLQYDENGYLWKVTDFKGNVTELQYEQINNTNYLKSITYAKGSSNNEKTITFTYSSTLPARLETVTDANGHTGEIKYNENNQVTKLIDPRNPDTFVTLDYQNRYTVYTDSRNNKTKYEYSPLENPTVNVTGIIENYGTTEATTTKYEWDKNLLKKEYEPDKNTGTAEKVTTSVEYDSKGNVISGNTTGGESIAQTIDSKNNVTNYSESSGVYENNIFDEKSNLISTTTNFSLTDYNNYDQYGNIIRSVSTTRGNYNRLINAQFEKNDTAGFVSDWTRYTSTNSGAYEQSSTSYTGNKSGKINLSGTATAGYYSQQFAVESSETQKIYTVAGQIKTENVTGEGARIRVYPLDVNKASITNSDGSRIEFLTKALTGTKDWTRISDTITLPSGTAYVRVDLLFKGSGSAYFDDAQVTYGTTLNQFATNENTSFEIGTATTASDWTLNSLASGDGRSSINRYAGQYSMRVTGAATSIRYAGQTVNIKGKKGTPISFSGWGYSTNSATTGKMALSLLLTNSSGVSKTYDVPFMQGNHTVNKWQFVKDTIFAEEDFVSAKLYVKYGNQVGTAYFDNVKVEAGGSAVSKTYSQEGNNIESETDALGNTTKYTYDKNGNELSVTDSTGFVKSREYNDLNLLKSTTIGTGNDTITSAYVFDKQGNITERKNPLGYITTYQYNKINMVEKETDPIGKFIKYDYDGETNLTHITRSDGKNSSVIEKRYDSKNNEAATYINNTLLFEKTYFKNNLLKTIQVNGLSGLYEFDYDDSKRLITAKTPDGFQLKNVYETAQNNPANGLRTSFAETLNGKTYTTAHTFDGLQRLTSITTSTGKKYNYYYNESSQPVRLQSDSSTQMLDFDADGQLLKQSIFAKDFLQLSYQYKENGNVATYFDGTKNHVYTYDFAGRLQTWNNGANTVTYQYDKVGNLLNPNGKTYTFNGANEINTFTYDYAGNLTKDNRLNYTWDGLDQLSATTDIVDSTNKVTYTYHPDGLRSTKTVGTTTYKYYYDGSDLVRVTDVNQNTIWAITWNNGKVVSLTNAAGETFEYVTNYRGDVVRILDVNGVTVATYDYDPWGNQLSTEPTDSRIKGQPIRYAGYVYDSETKLYYLQARYYDPATARFISRDPDPGDEDDPITMNGYSYADGNPVMMTDPDGHFAQVIPVAIAGYRLYKGYKTYKKITGLKKLQKGPGTYIIKYNNGYKYIGKGNAKRAGKSAKRYETGGVKAKSISWRPAKNNRNAFITEYKIMKRNGFYTNASKNVKNRNAKLYNKISSPGRKYHKKDYGKY